MGLLRLLRWVGDVDCVECDEQVGKDEGSGTSYISYLEPLEQASDV